MEIKLAEEVGKMPDLPVDHLAVRARAKELYKKYIADEMTGCKDTVRKVFLNCQGILSSSSSFIDELIFINIFEQNFEHGNSVLVLTKLSDEFYFDVRMAVEGKKKLIEDAKKKEGYFLTRKSAKQGLLEQNMDGAVVQVGSPYLLCEYQGKIEVLGFNEGEKQKTLLERIVQKGERLTASQLADQEDISRTAANNRLNRLYEKNLVFREAVTDDTAEKYEYFFT